MLKKIRKLKNRNFVIYENIEKISEKMEKLIQKINSRIMLNQKNSSIIASKKSSNFMEIKNNYM